jgi:DnaK suppressor protein
MRNDIDLKYFKKRLEERLEAITAGQKRQKKEAAPVELDQARVGRLSRMDAMQQQAMSQAAARLADLERQRIQYALARMESGDYGYCIICDEPFLITFNKTMWLFYQPIKQCLGSFLDSSIS